MAALPEPGSRFAQKYVIESELGHGTAGIVFSATHEELRHRVAIKILREAEPVAVERMIREARATIALHSEHVVRVMDVGREQGRAFLVMEHLEGADLATTLRERGPLPVSEAVDHVLHACAGIAEAHARGVVHRDLKPSNLFLTRRADGSPLVKVLDFGISKSTGPGASQEASLTGPAEMLGSPMYMSPEQVRGSSHVDHRTDVWALGVILFRLLTSKAPFAVGATVSSALAAVLEGEPTPLRDARPDAPAALDGIVRRCLAKSPAERPSSVAELAAALAPFGSDDGRAAVVRLVRDRQSGARPRSSNRIAAGILGAGAMTIVAWIVVVGARRPAPSQTIAPATAAAVPEVRVGSPGSSEASLPGAGAPPATASGTPSAPIPAAVVPRAPSVIRHAVPRPRPTSNSSVVRSAATDDRY
jgi:serine/threonine-protein kinase